MTPRYLQKYEEIRSKIICLPTNQHENLKQASWTVAIFSHAAQKKRFKSAERYLNQTHSILKEIPPFQKFAQSLKKQFDQFLLSKIGTGI